MKYCKLHDDKAYTEAEFKAIPEDSLCDHCLTTQGADDNKIRIFCASPTRMTLTDNCFIFDKVVV